MCDFFSGVVTRNFEVLTDLNSNSHEDVVRKHGLDDKLGVDDERRKWVRFELVPKNLFGKRRSNWKFKLDERIKPSWFNRAHEDACWDYLKRNIIGQPWLVAAGREVKRIKRIKWFKPMKEPDVDVLLPLAQELGRAFKIRGRIKVKLIQLDSAAGLAAWLAAGSAARSAAWSAARSAVFEVSEKARLSIAGVPVWSE